jgi:hypothetical protein
LRQLPNGPGLILVDSSHLPKLGESQKEEIEGGHQEFNRNSSSELLPSPIHNIKNGEYEIIICKILLFSPSVQLVENRK